MTDRRVILCAPTGAGKTIMFAYIAKNAVAKNTKTLILSSRTEILKQNAEKLEMNGLYLQYISPHNKYVPTTNIAVAMAQTLRRRLEKAKISEDWRQYVKSIRLLIIDECHENISNYIFPYLSDSCYVIGVTATPKRYGSQLQLGDLYSKIVDEVNVAELISLGYLVPAKSYTFQAPKLDDVAFDHVNGDYIQKQLAKKYEDKEHYEGVVSNYMRICNHTKAVVFCVSSEQAISITQEFIAKGIKAKYILSGAFDTDSKLSDEREQLVKDFRNGRIEVLVNVGILVAGFDAPEIETVIMAFATQSTTKYLQALGRGSRIAPLKYHFNILDFGGNINRLGFFEDVRTWSLWHENKVGGGIPPVKECPECFRFIPTTRMECPFCHHIFKTDKEIYEVELEEIVAGETDERKMSVPQWAAFKKRQGWSTQRILITAMMRNPTNKRKAFDEARKVLRTEKGDVISPQYYFFLKKNVLDKKKKS